MNTRLRKALQAALVSIMPCLAHAQSATVQGSIKDSSAKAISSMAVSLLYPEDSTLAFFGISDGDGRYQIPYVKSGKYLLQTAGMGYATYYQILAVPVSSGVVPTITMNALDAYSLDGIQVNAEKIPILLKKDTVEYNAGSFKTKPDAAVEDLLKKLPGVQVDKAGNIKAGGKDVQHVLVDGKEFFGDDPKVATKNLPADAIDKVQVFDGLSQQAQYTGIDDGERDKTINLKLKDSKRKGYFGDVEAGGGTDERFKLGGHYYRFKKNTQLAALGSFNNINQFGFSMQDYFSFSGGLRSMMDGGGPAGGQNAPINFGQQLSGLITSGAAGLNYTYESKKGRYNASYMGTGSKRELDQQTLTENFSSAGSFSRDEQLDEQKKDFGHDLSYNLRYDMDTMQQLRLNGTAGYNTSKVHRELLSSSIQSVLLNQLDSRTQNEAHGLQAAGNLSYIHRQKGVWPVLRLSLGGNVEQSTSNTDWNNATKFFTAGGGAFSDNQYQRNEGMKWGYNGSASITRKLGRSNFLEADLRAATQKDALLRQQGLAGDEENSIDSLSPQYARRYTFVRPGLSLRHSTEKLQYSVSLRHESGWLTSLLSGSTPTERFRSYLLPAAFWQYNPATSTSVNASYNSNIMAPAARQMLPATDYTNPLQRVHGNPMLNPEYQHNVRMSYNRFDAFSFTSLMASVTGRYVHDKINLARSINTDLSEDITYTNVPDDYNLAAHAEYNTPVRALGINLSLAANEQYNKGMSIVNGVLNTNNTNTYGGRLGIGNRMKEKWDAELSLSAAWTDSRYSIQQSLNSSFVMYSADAQLSYKPTDYLYLSAGTNVDRYQSASFPNTITVPLLQATASWFFLKARRGVLTLEGFDLLDRNRSVQRISQLNYLTEQRSNTIGRYVILSFKYRLSATGGDSPGGRVIMQTN
jgi:hypothetical protein